MIIRIDQLRERENKLVTIEQLVNLGEYMDNQYNIL